MLVTIAATVPGPLERAVRKHGFLSEAPAFSRRLTFGLCRTALSAERRGIGVGQQRAVRRHVRAPMTKPEHRPKALPHPKRQD